MSFVESLSLSHTQSFLLLFEPVIKKLLVVYELEFDLFDAFTDSEIVLSSSTRIILTRHLLLIWCIQGVVESFWDQCTSIHDLERLVDRLITFCAVSSWFANILVYAIHSASDTYSSIILLLHSRSPIVLLMMVFLNWTFIHFDAFYKTLIRARR